MRWRVGLPRTPERTMRPDHNGVLKRIEDHTFAPPEFHAPWDYVPLGPFRGQVMHESLHPRLCTFEVYASLYTVLERLCGLYLPPKYGYTAMVVDERFNVLFGYAATSVQAAIGEIEWYGVRAAFATIEQLGRYDPLDLAVWEGSAMRRAT